MGIISLEKCEAELRIYFGRGLDEYFDKPGCKNDEIVYSQSGSRKQKDGGKQVIVSQDTHPGGAQGKLIPILDPELPVESFLYHR
jgi:hypothetical protein